MEKKRGFASKLIVRLGLIFTGLIFVSSVAYFSLSFLNKVRLNVFIPEKIELDYDHIYSTELKNKLNDFIFNDLNLTNLDLNLLDLKKDTKLEPEKICESIKNEFDFVRDVVWDFSYPQVVKLKIIGTKPICKLNQKVVLVNNNRLFGFDYFQDIDSKLLRNFNCRIEILGDDIFNSDSFSSVCSFVQNISENIWQNYEPYYFNFSSVILKKITPNVSLTSVAIKPFYLVTQNYCLKNNENSQVDDLVSFVNQTATRKRNYLFDLRFSDRVYARPMLKKELEQLQNMGRV